MEKLKVANQPCSTITGANGHINERSLADYEEGDENEQQAQMVRQAVLFLRGGKHADDARREVEHQLPAHLKLSRAEVKCSTSKIDCR